MNANHYLQRAPFVALSIAILLGVACSRANKNTETGPTTRQVIERYRQPYTDIRERLKQIAQQLPAKGTVKNKVGESTDVTRVDLNPPPRYRRKIFEGPIDDNTGVLAAEQLLDPEVRPDFDLNFDGFPQSCFFWLSDAFVTKTNLDADGSHLQRGFEAGLARRYLMVYRPARYQKPLVVDSKSFTPGAIDLEVFLVDFQSPKILTSFLASAATSKEARYPSNANIEVHVVDTLRQNVRAVIADSIAKTTGGTIDYK